MALEFSVDQSPSSFGNHFIVGISGTTLSESDKRVLAAVRPVGILLLKRNLDHNAPYPDWIWNLRALIDQIKEISEREDLLITIDHEGQRVMRTPPPLTVFPNAIHFKDNAAAVARAHAKELRSIGINVSWAPDTDIHSNPMNPIIGERAFGQTYEEVVRYAIPYFEALTEEGILGCAKHFPGHGDTTTDSHHELPRVDLTEEELFARELIPFQAMIDAKVPMIMTAHILYPKIDPVYPATMSEKIITGILRNRMRFEGVVITDDLDMKAVASQFNDKNMVARALNVGCDMFIVARHPGPDEDRTLALAKNIGDALMERKLSEQTLFASFCRINHIFEELLPSNQPHILDQATLDQHQSLARTLQSQGT